jgi:hypothetical protein
MYEAAPELRSLLLLGASGWISEEGCMCGSLKELGCGTRNCGGVNGALDGH